MRVDRQDSLVVLAPPAAQLKVQTLLDDLRKSLRRSQVAVRISLVAIAPEAMDEIVKSGRTVAVTAQEKAALAKSAGKKLSEMQLLATDGRRAELTRTDKADRQGDAPATETTAAAWVIPTVLKDGAVALTFEAGFTKETTGAGEKIPSLKSEFRLRTTVQLPDGAMMVLGGGTLGEAGTQQVYVLIEVQVIAPAKAK
jgi:type II secretory pathway component GspD/PulD (secretin)